VDLISILVAREVTEEEEEVTGEEEEVTEVLPQQWQDEHDGAVDGEEPGQPHGRLQLVAQQELL